MSGKAKSLVLRARMKKNIEEKHSPSGEEGPTRQRRTEKASGKNTPPVSIGG